MDTESLGYLEGTHVQKWDLQGCPNLTELGSAESDEHLQDTC